VQRALTESTARANHYRAGSHQLRQGQRTRHQSRHLESDGEARRRQYRGLDPALPNKCSEWSRLGRLDWRVRVKAGSGQTVDRCLVTNRLQLKYAIPELRKSKGCVVWVSSGAAMNPYVAWAAYGSSKAALHSIATHLAIEEPDICSVSIQPGRVDTDLQKTIREQGQASMDSNAHAGFVDDFNSGRLLKPEVPAAVMARVVTAPQWEWNGRNFRFVLVSFFLSLESTLTDF